MSFTSPLTPSRSPSINAHTGLRGIAAVTVVVAHLILNKVFPEYKIFEKISPLFSWFNECVDLFFILSGFILNWVYLQTGQVDWRSYLSARVARILPLYFLTLFFMLALDCYTWAFHGTVNKDLNPLTLLVNFSMVAGLWGGHSLCINGPSWSVCVEMVLYVSIFPLLCLCVSRLRGRIVNILLVFLGLAGFAACYGSPTWPDWAEMGRGIFGFIIGFCCCSLWRQTTLSPRFTNMLGVLACVVALCAIFNLISLLFLIFSFPVLVYCTAGDRGIAGKLFGHRLLTWLGDRSYSIYLWHYPIIIFVNRLLIYSHVQSDGRASIERRLLAYSLIVLACILSADLSYRYFECPARDWLRQWLNKRAFTRSVKPALTACRYCEKS